MSFRTASVTIFLVILGLFAWKHFAASKQVIPNSHPLASNVIRLEGDPWSGYAYFRASDFLAGTGLDYKYVEEDNQSKRAQDMVEGRCNFLVTTMNQVLKNRPQGTIVAMIDESTGADALVFNTKKYPYLKSVDNLPYFIANLKAQGKKPVLAFADDSPSSFLLEELSNQYDTLHLTDFDLRPVDQSSTAYKMLSDGTADVAVLWEPDTSAARRAGFTVALSSRDVPNSVLDVVVASDYVIVHQPELVQKVVDAMYQARAKAIANPKAFVKFIAEDADPKFNSEDADKQRSGLADAVTTLNGIHLFDAQEANTYLNQSVSPLDETKAYEALENIAGLLSLKDPSIKPNSALIDGQYAQKAAEHLR